jgi:hypothetical protein
MTEQAADNTGESSSLPAMLQGEMYEKNLLDTEVQKAPGLVTFMTKDGAELCPADQFVEDSKGYYVLRPELSALWATSRVYDEQLSVDSLATFARFKTPQDTWQGRSWWDVLTVGSPDDETVERIKNEILEDMVRRNEHGKGYGVHLRDPRTIL